MKQNFLSPRFVLPAAVLLGVLVMGLRAADMWDVIASGKLWLHPAQAEDAAPPKAASAKEAAVATKTPDTPTEPSVTIPPPDADASPAELDKIWADYLIERTLAEELRREVADALAAPSNKK